MVRAINRVKLGELTVYLSFRMLCGLLHDLRSRLKLRRLIKIPSYGETSKHKPYAS